MTPPRRALLERAGVELLALYGAAEADALLAWMSDRPPLSRSRASAAAHVDPHLGHPIDQRTSILTVYPDHVADDARPPMEALDAFLRQHLDGAFTHLHVLPFLCADGDDGYAITDHRRVHPRLGDWAALRRLGAGRQLVCDFVANHVSTAHPLFLELCARGDSPYFRHRATPAATTWGYRVRTSELYQPFATAAGTRWVFCTYGRAQADLDYRSPQTLRFALEELEHLLGRGAAVLRLDALPHLWKAEDAWGPHHPNVVRVLRVLRCFTELVAPGALLFAETQYRADAAYFGELGAQLGNELAVPLLLLGCLVGDCQPLAEWLRRRATPSTTTTPLLFLNTHDGMHLLPLSPPLPPATSGPLFERLRAGGVVVATTEHDGETLPYELNSPLACVVRALREGGQGGGLGGSGSWSDAYLALHAVLLALPGIPQIYLPNLVAAHLEAERRDGDGDGGFTGAGPTRSLNRRKFGPELAAGLGSGAPRALLEELRGMLAARAALPGLHPHAGAEVLDSPPGVLHFRRGSGGAAVEVIANFSTSPQLVAGGGARSGGRSEGRVVDALAAARAHRGGEELAPPRLVAPLEVRWLVAEPAP